MASSYSKIQRELRTYFGLTISAGELPSMVAEIARLFGPAYARLLELMRQQAAIHIDETSWRVDGVPHWLWVFINDVVALYVVSRSRGSKVPQALLGPDFDGVAISDFFSAYSPLEVEKAKCWAHLLRDSHDYAKGQDAESERHARYRNCTRCLWRWAWRSNRCRPTSQSGSRSTIRCERNSGSLRPSSGGLGNASSWPRSIQKYLDDLVVWLKNPAADPTNHRSGTGAAWGGGDAQNLRSAAARRGAQSLARLLSIVWTSERQGKGFLGHRPSSLVDARSQS